MKIDEAIAEAKRWLASLDARKQKALAMAKIAADRRSGAIDEQEGRRRVRSLDGVAPTVYDAAKLEKAVRVLIKGELEREHHER